MSIAENIAEVQKNIALAAASCGRQASEITLVAASKMNDASRVQEAIAAGITACGENRVQEMLEKHAQGAYQGAHLHFIGHLQKNKVKNIVGIAELIHSVDSVPLLEVIGRTAEAKGIVQQVLLEVNIGAEASKSGFAPEELPAALAAAEQIPGILVRGLMAIPPACTHPDEIRPYFARMQQLFVDIGSKKYDNSNMDFLSMGMSHDYSLAIEYGSNIVRVGTAIFGARDYGVKAQ